MNQMPEMCFILKHQHNHFSETKVFFILDTLDRFRHCATTRCEFKTQAAQLVRDAEEKRWIHRLGTILPQGLNLLDLFLLASHTPLNSYERNYVTGRTLKPIFHKKACSCWLPKANKIDTNNMKSTWPT